MMMSQSTASLSSDRIVIRVKGSRASAEKAMKERGLTAPVLLCDLKDVTSWAVPSAHRPAVVSWFCEPAVCADGTGFPDGTLLHHS